LNAFLQGFDGLLPLPLLYPDQPKIEKTTGKSRSDYRNAREFLGRPGEIPTAQGRVALLQKLF
jgi:hypothetical protein